MKLYKKILLFPALAASFSGFGQTSIEAAGQVSLPFSDFSETTSNFVGFRLSAYKQLNDFASVGLTSGMDFGAGRSTEESINLVIFPIEITRSFETQMVPVMLNGRVQLNRTGFAPYFDLGLGMTYIKTISNYTNSGIDLSFIEDFVDIPFEVLPPEDTETLEEEFLFTIRPTFGVLYDVGKTVKINTYTSFNVIQEFPVLSFGIGLKYIFNKKNKTKALPLEIETTR